MLSKTKESMYGVVIASKASYDMYGNAGSYHTILTTNAPADGTYKIIAKVKRQASWDSYLAFTIGSFYQNVTIYNTEYEEISKEATAVAWDRVELGGRNYNNNDRLYLQDIKIIRSLVDFTATVAVTWIPNGLSTLGELGIITIFWVLNDGTRKQAPSSSEFSSTASTGSITPGNYVGYVTIEAKDGTIYKVWVYNT